LIVGVRPTADGSLWCRRQYRLGGRPVPEPLDATVVRRAETADWERSRALRLQALADTPLAFASTYQREIELPPAEWRRRIADAAQFLAVDFDGSVVGTATGFRDPVDPTTVLLVAMYVRPAARGRGLGERLVAAVVEDARRAGADRVRLHVVETNPGAERLYARCGFVRTGATVPLPHRTDLRELEMELSLTGDVGDPN
jgi:GNAT superfamily N-acetyltransferase